MEYSIYHIENDIDCRVLKFGKEICVAIAGEDSQINLCKGRHKLTFISTGNENDSYSIIQEVQENGIEDFIEVNLAPIRLKRIHEEEIDELILQEKREREYETYRLYNIKA